MKRLRESYVVIGEGITEKHYFDSIREVVTHRPRTMVPKNSSLTELEVAIKACLIAGYSKIFCLIDMDNKVADGNPSHEAYAAEYQRFRRKYHKQRLRNSLNDITEVILVESFPSTEIFFSFYWGYSSHEFTNAQLKQMLKERFGYSTEGKYLLKHPLHDTMVRAGGSLDVAIAASRQSVSQRVADNPHFPYSEIGEMIELNFRK